MEASQKIREKIERHGMLLLRLSIGLLFLWFGILKFYENLSDAESLAAKTISWITSGQLKGRPAVVVLAAVESIIGFGMLTKRSMRFVIPLLYLQMAGTLMPLFLFPKETWKVVPFAPTLEGQYILKNAVIISAAIVLGAIANGGKLIQDPNLAHEAKRAERAKNKN